MPTVFDSKQLSPKGGSVRSMLWLETKFYRPSEKAKKATPLVTEIELKWPGFRPCPAPPCNICPPKSVGKKIVKKEDNKNVKNDGRVLKGLTCVPCEKKLPMDQRRPRRFPLQKSPPPSSLKTPARKHMEELTQRPPEVPPYITTELYLEQKPIAPYIPGPKLIHVGTEIAEGELFHFDAVAEPIIEKLVDYTIDLSILEVAEALEYEKLRKKQELYLAQREAEIAVLRSLEAEEMRLKAEKERRLQQEAIAKELDEEMQKSVVAAKLIQGQIVSLIPEVIDNMEPATAESEKHQLGNALSPWLVQEVAHEIEQTHTSRELLNLIILEVIEERARAYTGYGFDEIAMRKSPEIIAEEGEEAEEISGYECSKASASYCTCESAPTGCSSQEIEH